jgi:hypothetical protein
MDCSKFYCNLDNCDKYYCGKPVFNWKCIILTLVLSFGYWYLPYKNPYVLISILYFTYIALAWYDYIYICERNLGPTYLSLFYWWIKPPQSQQILEYKNWHPEIKNQVMYVDLIIAIGIIYCVLIWKFEI